MKKKVILGKKLFLNKETITELTKDEKQYFVGGATAKDQICKLDTTGVTVEPGGPQSFGGSLCGPVNWRTFDAHTVCTTYGGSFDCKK